jgi:plasmid stabilization system protein ParE
VNIIWSAQARKDLRAIKAFIARDSEHYAQMRGGKE